jgi:hypothetical protein
MIKLTPANLSYGVVIIPSEPIYTQISKASLEISKFYKNLNIIDNVKFPSHITLIISGTNSINANEIAETLKVQTSEYKNISLTANQLFCNNGFIEVSCQKGKEEIFLLKKVFEVCSEFHRQIHVFRPHLLSRWDTLKESRQKQVIDNGTYKTPETTNMHLSVALVDKSVSDHCYEISRNLITIPQEFKIDKFQFIDMGHNNEKWEVLFEW